MKPIGLILLCCGFLVAAYCSVANLENEDNKWSTIPWLWYGLGMSVGVVGVVLLRAASAQDRSDETKTEAEFSAIQQSLHQLLSKVKELRARQEKLSPDQIVQYIDDECSEPFSDFADARSALSKRFGLSVYAEVMTQFASGERYVNRSWSAAADGYVDEVKTSLERAEGHLSEAKTLIVAAEKNHAGS